MQVDDETTEGADGLDGWIAVPEKLEIVGALSGWSEDWSWTEVGDIGSPSPSMCWVQTCYPARRFQMMLTFSE